MGRGETNQKGNKFAEWDGGGYYNPLLGRENGESYLKSPGIVQRGEALTAQPVKEKPMRGARTAVQKKTGCSYRDKSGKRKASERKVTMKKL